ncbi:MAG: hypothetical protein WC428_05050 [Candidatus Paceibacterota bacterium]|jgi:hypothetical protein
MKTKNISILILSFILLSFVPNFARADYYGQRNNFFVDYNFGILKVSQVSATLQNNNSSAISYYFDDQFWNTKTDSEKKEINLILDSLSSEFELNIYPRLTTTFGNEANPGIDKEKNIIVLFYPMIDKANGYVRNIDGYEKTVIPESNQREMIYLNTKIIDSPILKSFLSHEFMHLIELNQKELRTGDPEEVWLNELRAEYAPTLLGYNIPTDDNSYLKSRVETFLNKPYDSLIDWHNDVSDYGTIFMFGHYLVDQYGIDILSDSLRLSQKTGIDSINDALKRKGINDTFDSIFKNWIVASYLNDCSANTRYCYKDNNLIDFHIIPFSNFMPFSGESSLSINQTLSNWSAHWQKFNGANKTLKLQFDGKNQKEIGVIYVIRDYSGKYEVKELVFDNNMKGEIVIPNMGIDKSSIMLMPFVGGDSKSEYFYSITASTINPADTELSNNTENNIKLPFSIDKPLNQMNREELLIVLLKVIIYLVSQGKLTF